MIPSSTDQYASTIIDTLREPLVVLDSQLTVVVANASFCRTFDIARDEMVGKRLGDVAGGALGSDTVRHLVNDVLPDDREIEDVEVQIPSASSGIRTMLVNARRLRQRGGEEALVLLVFEDVTVRRQLESALHVAVAELERSNHELESFASIASHDLQEPLRKIQAFGERLEAACEGQLPEKGRDYLARMMAAASRMQRLITDLLTLSRVAMNKPELRAVNLQTIIAEVLVDLEETLTRTGGEVNVGPMPVVEADPTQMRQLFQNLLANALKFHGQQPPVVHVVATRTRFPLPPVPPLSKHVVWRIVVSDNGIGFDPVYAERIFRPFERLHGRDAFEGTGIGLALCQKIVRRLGGTIAAEAEPGGGARFIMHLPERQVGS